MTSDEPGEVDGAALWSGRLADHENALGLRIKIVEEIVAAGLQWTQSDDAFAIARHYLFHPQADALEFHRRRVKVFHAQLDRHLGGSMNFGWLEAMILYTDVYARRLLGVCRKAGCGENESDKNNLCNHSGHRHCSG